MAGESGMVPRLLILFKFHVSLSMGREIPFAMSCGFVLMFKINKGERQWLHQSSVLFPRYGR